MKIRFKNVETREVIHECDISIDLEMPTPHSMVDVKGTEYFAVAMKRCYESHTYAGGVWSQRKVENVTVLEVLLATEEQYPKYIPRQEEH